MSNFMMNLISWILLLLVILTLYLIDKVNKLSSLQEEALQNPTPTEPPPELEPPGDILFAGLEGKDLWDAMNKYFPDDDKKLMINCGLVYLEKINPVKGKPCEGARAMKNFYGPTEAYWKFEKEAVEERGNQ